MNNIETKFDYVMGREDKAIVTNILTDTMAKFNIYQLYEMTYNATIEELNKDFKKHEYEINNKPTIELIGHYIKFIYKVSLFI